MMTSEQSWADGFDLSPTDFLLFIGRYVSERFVGAEIRKEAVDRSIKVLLDLLPQEEETVALLRVADFYESVGEPPPMIAAGILASNNTLLISGKPKSGKTFLLLQMADDVASGKPLFGRWEIERPGPVVYLAMEGSKFQFRERIEKRGMHIRNPEVYVYHARRDLSTPKGVAWLVDLITPLKPALVIIDTARQAFKIDDWNNPSIVQTRLQPITEAVQRNGAIQFPEGCSCVIAHHNNKNQMAEGGDKISGTNAFQGIVDGYIVLDHKRRTADGSLQVQAECEGRIDMPDKITFLMNPDTLQVKALDDDEASRVKATNANAALLNHIPVILNIVDGEPTGMTAAEIETKSGLTLSYLSRILKLMMSDGTLIKIGEKKRERGGPSATIYGSPAKNGHHHSSLSNKEKNDDEGAGERVTVPQNDPLSNFMDDNNGDAGDPYEDEL